MADTTSIASRMEKLAQLKRMKEGLTSDPAPAPVEPAPEIEAAIPSVEEFENFASAEPSLPTDAPQTMDTDTSALDTPSIQNDVSAEHVESSEGSSDFDPASVWEEEPAVESAKLNDEIRPETDESDVNFVMDGAADDLADESMIPEDLREDDTVDVRAAESDDEPNNGLSASALGIDDEAFADFDEIAAVAGAGSVAAAVATSASSATEIGSDIDAVDESVTPDFAANEVDAELLKQEFENEAAPEELSAVSTPPSPIADENADGRISVSFDESRSTLLNHVSRQMGCSVEDVVVTALDWYLDALFGEDEEAKSA